MLEMLYMHFQINNFRLVDFPLKFVLYHLYDFPCYIIAHRILRFQQRIKMFLCRHTFIIHHTLHAKTDVTDRKSTRLNSSHVSISYAVFCLKKKKTRSKTTKTDTYATAHSTASNCLNR